MNDVDELKSNYGKLFYFITYMSKMKQITNEERVRLKEIIIQERADSLDLIDNYNSNGDSKAVVRSLQDLLKCTLIDNE